jgi:predicted nucleic acid-binding protein
VRWLVDTNVLSELRKGERCSPRVAAWAEAAGRSLYTSVLVIGEIRRGIERLRRKDRKQAAVLEGWLERVRTEFAGRLFDVDERVAEEWGRMSVPDPIPVVDGLLVATAKVHGLTLATRNTFQIAGTGVAFVNPFSPP